MTEEQRRRELRVNASAWFQGSFMADERKKLQGSIREGANGVTWSLGSLRYDPGNGCVTICDMDKDTFRRKREHLDMTQEQLAKRLGINRITIIRYESGESSIPKAVEMALKLIEAEEEK